MLIRAIRGKGFRETPPSSSPAAALLELRRWVTKVRLKWVKNKGFDHIIDRDTDVKAAVLLKDAIKRSPTGIVAARNLEQLRRTLGITVPVLRFLRRYPTLFCESRHPRYPTLPAFSLTDAADLLDRRESDAIAATQIAAVGTLTRLLMMSPSRSLPLAALHGLRYDLGLPRDFSSSSSPFLSPPHRFSLSRRKYDGVACLSLDSVDPDLAVSVLQRRSSGSSESIVFPMSFPRGYGAMKKVQAWMEEFHRLPYISPYDDFAGLDPDSDLMEKRVVGVLHELLSLTIHKKTKRNYLRGLRSELGLPHRFTRVFTRYPGIFYLSLKCKTVTVMLREGYQRGKLVEKHPLAQVRDKYYYVMRTGVLYRGKGHTRLVIDDDEEYDDSPAFSGDRGEDEEEFYEMSSSGDSGDESD